MSIDDQTPKIVEEGKRHISELWSILEAQGHGAYIGESISQLEHSLQAAHFAEEESADESTVLAALLHDVGQFIPMDTKKQCVGSMRDESGQDVGRMGHDKLGENYLKQHKWPSSVYRLVGAHVDAKRYLTIDQNYHEKLSNASKSSLKHQGGPFTQTQAQEFRQDPLWQKKLQLRLWDDKSKVVGLQTKSLKDYQEMAERIWIQHNISSTRVQEQ